MSADPKADPLSVLRHDMRTPINQIMGYAELLKEEAADSGAGAMVKDLDKVVGAARSLLGMINDSLVREHLEELLAGGIRVAATPNRVAAEEAVLDADCGVCAVTGRILVVDDVEANRDLLARRLERQGHRTACAADGAAALELLKKEPFDLALLDILMPGMDGRELLARMKADETLRHIPVIMISAVDELASVVRCIEAGAEDYLPKPFSPTLLRARIGACLEKKRLRDQERQHLKVIEETQARLADELAQASNYIRSLIPLPAGEPIPTDWRLIPSSELGGDSFGYHWLDTDHFAMYLLDVVGHGVGAALLSTTAIKVLLTGALPGVDFRDPGKVLTALNDVFLMEKHNNMYFTIWYGVFDRRSRTLKYSVAGHPPALLARQGIGKIEELEGQGSILGIFEGTVYGTFSCPVPTGSKLFLLSDGAYEIRKTDGKMVKYDEFVEVISGLAASGDTELDRIVDWARGHHGPGPLDDDLSILKLRL